MLILTEATGLPALDLVQDHVARIEGILAQLQRCNHDTRSTSALNERFQAHLFGLELRKEEAIEYAALRLHSRSVYEAGAASIILNKLSPKNAANLAEGLIIRPELNSIVIMALRVFDEIADVTAPTPTPRTSLVEIPTERLEKPEGSDRGEGPSPGTLGWRPNASNRGGETANIQPPLKPIVTIPPTRDAVPLVTRTMLALDGPREPALPFVSGNTPLPIPKSNVPILQPKGGHLRGTALALDVPRGPALPFSRADEPIGRKAGATGTRVEDLRGTALALDIPLTAALPFVADATPVAPDVLGTPRQPIRPRADDGLRTTVLAMEVPRGPALPFSPSTSEGTKSMSTPLRPIVVPSNRHRLGRLSLDVKCPGTLGGVADHQLGALGRPQQPTHVLPPLTLKQHASLCVEIARYPDRLADILARYQLTSELRAQIDAYFHAAMAQDTAMRREWEGYYAIYDGWFKGF